MHAFVDAYARLVKQKGSVWIMLWPLCVGGAGNTFAGDERGRPEATSAILTGHTDRITAVRFSPDGKTLASADFDGVIRLWDVASKKMKRTLTQPGPVRSMAFSPDGKWLVTGGMQNHGEDGIASVAFLWEVVSGRQVASLEGELGSVVATAIVFSPDGKTLAMGSLRNVSTKETKVLLWDFDTRKVRTTLQLSQKAVDTLTYTPDGKALVVGGWGKDDSSGFIEIWQIDPTPRVKFSFGEQLAPVTSVAVSGDGKLLATGGGDIYKAFTQLALWDLKTGKKIYAIECNKYPVYSVSFSPNGKILASAGGDQYRKMAELKLWDVAANGEVASLKGHSDLVGKIAFSHDGKLLASGSSDKTVILWEVDQWTKTQRKELKAKGQR